MAFDNQKNLFLISLFKIKEYLFKYEPLIWKIPDIYLLAIWFKKISIYRNLIENKR